MKQNSFSITSNVQKWYVANLRVSGRRVFSNLRTKFKHNAVHTTSHLTRIMQGFQLKGPYFNFDALHVFISQINRLHFYA